MATPAQKPSPSQVCEAYFVPSSFTPWSGVLLEAARPERGERVLDLPDGALDLVLSQQGMQFLPDRPAAAREMRRVIADGARTHNRTGRR